MTPTSAETQNYTGATLRGADRIVFADHINIKFGNLNVLHDVYLDKRQKNEFVVLLGLSNC